MAKWTIDKEFNFEMGHRVHAQKLPHEHLSITTDCACKHLHGHSYTIKVFLTADHLDDSAMVTDFKNLNFMKRFVDDVLDHKFMIDINDPLFYSITGISRTEDIEHLPNFTNLGDWLKISKTNIDDNLKDLIDSFVLVDFVPTSENICRHLKEYAQSQIGHIATVSALELWETKKSHARYED